MTIAASTAPLPLLDKAAVSSASLTNRRDSENAVNLGKAPGFGTAADIGNGTAAAVGVRPGLSVWSGVGA
jgi:hypothetical protein